MDNYQLYSVDKNNILLKNILNLVDSKCIKFILRKEKINKLLLSVH